MRVLVLRLRSLGGWVVVGVHLRSLNSYPVVLLTAGHGVSNLPRDLDACCAHDDEWSTDKSSFGVDSKLKKSLVPFPLWGSAHTNSF